MIKDILTDHRSHLGYGNAAEALDQMAGIRELVDGDPGFNIVEMEEDRELFETGVAGAIAQAVECDVETAGSAPDCCPGIGDRQTEIVVTVKVHGDFHGLDDGADEGLNGKGFGRTVGVVDDDA